MLSVNYSPKDTYMRGVSKTAPVMSQEWGGPLSLFCLTHNKEYKLSTNHPHARAGMERACAITGMQTNSHCRGTCCLSVLHLHVPGDLLLPPVNHVMLERAAKDSGSQRRCLWPQ